MHTVTLTIKATGELADVVEREFAEIITKTQHEYCTGRQIELKNIPGKFVIAYPAKGTNVAGQWAYHGYNIGADHMADTRGHKYKGVIDFAYCGLR